MTSRSAAPLDVGPQNPSWSHLRLGQYRARPWYLFRSASRFALSAAITSIDDDLGRTTFAEDDARATYSTGGMSFRAILHTSPLTHVRTPPVSAASSACVSLSTTWPRGSLYFSQIRSNRSTVSGWTVMPIDTRIRLTLRRSSDIVLVPFVSGLIATGNSTHPATPCQYTSYPYKFR